MAIRNIRKEGDPLLRKKSRKIEIIDERIKMLIEDMAETMKESEGVGIAAPQVGVLRRLFVIDLRDDKGLRVFINPEIIEKNDDEEIDIEGCLSVPEQSGFVKRPTKIRLRYQDEDGQSHEIEASDYFARVIQHENDHLNGVLYIDKKLAKDDPELVQWLEEQEKEEE
ncbi:MAG: peptide deformylase [Tissierellia bacterium]|nr:peptide deformylase [Tissierellia bacterium]